MPSTWCSTGLPSWGRRRTPLERVPRFPDSRSGRGLLASGLMRLAACPLTRLSLVLASAPLAFATPEPPPRPFLRQVIQLDDGRIASIDRGEVVTKLLPTAEKAEVAAFGAARAARTPEILLPWPGTSRDSGRSPDPRDQRLLEASDARRPP